MNILVNYKIKNGEVRIDECVINGKNVLPFNGLYDLTKIAIVSTDLDNTDELRLVKFPELPFPTIVTKEMEEEILKRSNQNNDTKNKKENEEPIESDIEVGNVIIEQGEKNS